MGRNAPPRLVILTSGNAGGGTTASSPAAATPTPSTPRPHARTHSTGSGSGGSSRGGQSAATAADPALRPRTADKRGFAADPQRAAEAGRRGGKRGQAKGTAHRWTTEEARRAGGLRGDPGMGKGVRRKRG